MIATRKTTKVWLVLVCLSIRRLVIRVQRERQAWVNVVEAGVHASSMAARGIRHVTNRFYRKPNSAMAKTTIATDKRTKVWRTATRAASCLARKRARIPAPRARKMLVNVMQARRYASQVGIGARARATSFLSRRFQAMAKTTIAMVKWTNPIAALRGRFWPKVAAVCSSWGRMRTAVVERIRKR